MGLYEYNILKSRIERLGREMKEKGKEVNSSNYPLGKGKCFYEYTESIPSFGEWETSTELYHYKECSELKCEKGCQKTDCPGYEPHKEYREIKRKYDEARKGLDYYPLLSLINPPKIN